jgi:hypothetical protein
MSSASQCTAGAIPDAIADASDVQLLVAAGSSIPPGSWSSYRYMAVQVATCAAPGTRLDIHPITAMSFSTPSLFSGSVPQPDRSTSANRLLLLERQRMFADGVTTAIERLPRMDVGGRSDPIGALKVAADELSKRPVRSHRVIIAIFSGWQQAAPANIYVYHTDPRQLINVSISRLKAAGAMPELNGIDVSIFGISPGTMKVSDIHLQEMCGFWERSCGRRVESSAPAPLASEGRHRMPRVRRPR